MFKKSVILILVFLIITGAIGLYFYVEKYRPNTEVITFYDELYLIVEDELVDSIDPVIFNENVLYFSLPIVKHYIDQDIFYDEEEETLIITNEEKVLRYRLDEQVATVNSKEFITDNVITEFNKKVYIPIDILLRNYRVDINYFENTNAVVLDFTDYHYLKGEVILDKAVIRTDLSIKAPIIYSELSIGTLVNIYGEYEQWYKVRTLDGVPGFIEKKFIKVNYDKDIFKVKINNDEVKKDRRIINLTWDYTYSKVKNTNNIGLIPGVNVISPTWFSITNEHGNIVDKGNKDYANKYLEYGYEVWPLIDNSFDPDLTHELLSKSSKREKLINDILDIYIDYGFQGINIDFENIHLKTRDYLTQFVRELYPVFKDTGMMVSMDVTGISTSENWSLCYDRERLSKVVDYMMLMAYDQHWASSPVAGSVAEYPWVENSILGVLRYVPNDKLVLGVPFYTRLWIEKDGKLSSQALSMERANRFIEENNIELIWDENILQFYGQLEKDDVTYKIWIEDSNSLEAKASLVHKYDLAGVASWRKGFETEDIWVSLEKVLY
ncbi:MAG: glycoside hydrolase [Tissierellia bacterium]|nr:glycoside hydrolase [Tissierellia bacterium]